MTMDERTLTALTGSISKWESVAAGTTEDAGASNCALCAEFFERPQRDYCEGCPVAAKTGHPECWATPYMWWLDHQREAHQHLFGPYRAQPGCAECARIAGAELDFLKSLLP